MNLKLLPRRDGPQFIPPPDHPAAVSFMLYRVTPRYREAADEQSREEALWMAFAEGWTFASPDPQPIVENTSLWRRLREHLRRKS